MVIYLVAFIVSWALLIFFFRKSKSVIIKYLGSLCLACVMIVIVGFIKGDIGESNSNSQALSEQKEIVHNVDWDGSVSQVKAWLIENLKDPRSYEGIEWSKVQKVDLPSYKYMVRHKYRAKNSFGGYAIEKKIFYLDSSGNVVSSEDYE